MRRRWITLLLGILACIASGCTPPSGVSANHDQRGGFYGGIEFGHSSGGDGGADGGGM